jgi:isopropylmalate/homocitrate/citramalate synthase
MAQQNSEGTPDIREKLMEEILNLTEEQVQYVLSRLKELE